MCGCMVDLKYAFYHVTMAWAFHVFLAFVVDGQTYVFQVMPFGLSVAPWAFSKNTKPIKSHLHILLYLFTPIWMIFSLPHPGSLWFQTSYILSLLQQLSLQVHLTKSHLAPSQTVEYLGVVFHLDTLQITPESKVSRILLTCRGAIRRRTCSWRQLECLVGLLSLASYYDPLGRLKLRPSAG